MIGNRVFAGGAVGEVITSDPDDTDNDEIVIRFGDDSTSRFSNREVVKNMPFFTPEVENPNREAWEEARLAVQARCEHDPVPGVGSRVLVHGREGQVLLYDPRDPSLMYKVLFDDGTADWFSHADVCMEAPSGSSLENAWLEDARLKREQEASIHRALLRRAYEEERKAQELQAEWDRQNLPKQERTRLAAEQAKRAQIRLREVLCLAHERDSIERGLGCALCRGQCERVSGVPSGIAVEKCQRCGFTTKVTEAGWIGGGLERLAGLFICQCR